MGRAPIGVRWVEGSNGLSGCNVVATSGQAGRGFIWPIPVRVAAHLPHGLRRVELHAVAVDAAAVAELPPLVVVRHELSQCTLARGVIEHAQGDEDCKEPAKNGVTVGGIARALPVSPPHEPPLFACAAVRTCCETCYRGSSYRVCVFTVRKVAFQNCAKDERGRT